MPKIGQLISRCKIPVPSIFEILLRLSEESIQQKCMKSFYRESSSNFFLVHTYMNIEVHRIFGYYSAWQTVHLKKNATANFKQ